MQSATKKREMKQLAAWGVAYIACLALTLGYALRPARDSRVWVKVVSDFPEPVLFEMRLEDPRVPDADQTPLSAVVQVLTNGPMSTEEGPPADARVLTMGAGGKDAILVPSGTSWLHLRVAVPRDSNQGSFRLLLRFRPDEKMVRQHPDLQDRLVTMFVKVPGWLDRWWPFALLHLVWAAWWIFWRICCFVFLSTPKGELQREIPPGVSQTLSRNHRFLRWFWIPTFDSRHLLDVGSRPGFMGLPVSGLKHRHFRLRFPMKGGRKVWIEAIDGPVTLLNENGEVTSLLLPEHPIKYKAIIKSGYRIRLGDEISRIDLSDEAFQVASSSAADSIEYDGYYVRPGGIVLRFVNA